MSRTTKPARKAAAPKAGYPEPPRRHRPRRRGRAIFFGLLKVAVIGGAFASIAYPVNEYLKNSPRYLVQHIAVEGATLIPPTDVVNASGITSGDNLMSIDTAAVTDRVMKIPYVHTCDVRREYPDRVVIKISERHPGAMLLVDNKAWEIDDECVVLGELNPLEPYEGPTITNLPDVTKANMAIGKRLDSEALLAALEVWKAFSTVPMSQTVKLSEISAPSPDQISMILDGVGFEIIWGRSQFLTQARRLDTLWQKQAGRLPCRQSLSLQFDADLVCR